jgi:hypothetical protein
MTRKPVKTPTPDTIDFDKLSDEAIDRLLASEPISRFPTTMDSQKGHRVVPEFTLTNWSRADKVGFIKRAITTASAQLSRELIDELRKARQGTTSQETRRKTAPSPDIPLASLLNLSPTAQPSIIGPPRSSSPEPQVGEARIGGEGRFTADATLVRRPTRTKSAPAIIKNRTTIIRYSQVIIVALQEALDYNPRRTNQPPPALWLNDPDYLKAIRDLVTELKRLNDLLAVQKPARKEAKTSMNLIKVLVDKGLAPFLTTMGIGGAMLLLAAIQAMLHQAGLEVDYLGQAPTMLRLK